MVGPRYPNGARGGNVRIRDKRDGRVFEVTSYYAPPVPLQPVYEAVYIPVEHAEILDDAGAEHDEKLELIRDMKDVVEETIRTWESDYGWHRKEWDDLIHRADKILNNSRGRSIQKWEWDGHEYKEVTK